MSDKYRIKKIAWFWVLEMPGAGGTLARYFKNRINAEMVRKILIRDDESRPSLTPFNSQFRRDDIDCFDFSKWGPCKHCLPNSNLPCEADFHELTLSGEVLLHYDSDFGWEGQKVNFCPWCGRPLTDKAAKSLNKKLEEI